MLSYCLVCKKTTDDADTKKIIQKGRKIKNKVTVYNLW